MTEQQWRTRWKRWLGAKTRYNEPEWTNLLKCEFIGWAYSVSGEKYIPVHELCERLLVKGLYAKAIDKATTEDFQKLDGIFCEDQFKRKHK